MKEKIIELKNQGKNYNQIQKILNQYLKAFQVKVK